MNLIVTDPWDHTPFDKYQLYMATSLSAVIGKTLNFKFANLLIKYIKYERTGI